MLDAHAAPDALVRWLRSSGSAGVDLPVIHTARIHHTTGRACLGIRTRLPELSHAAPGFLS